jgi:ABC-type lipoprotein release transport system permease subunit
MTSVWARVRADLRFRWRAWLALAVVVSLAGGVAVTLAAGAKRTDSAYTRLIDAEQPIDAVIRPPQSGEAPPAPDELLAQLDALPQVADAFVAATAATYEGRTDRGQRIGDPDYVTSIAPLDDHTAARLARQKLVDGRHPDQSRPDEITVGFGVSERYGLTAGNTVELRLLDPETTGAFIDEATPPPPSAGLRLTFRVVGVTAAAGEFPPRSQGDGVGTINFTPVFSRTHPQFLTTEGVAVRLHRGAADFPAFKAEVERLAGTPFDAIGFTPYDQHTATRRSIHLLAVGLWVLAGLVALAALLVVGQAASRQVFLEAAEHPTLRAMGMGRGQLFAVAMAPAGVAAMVGALGSAVVAVALSGLFPIGLARTAEPNPGVALDGLAVAGGAALVALLLLLVAVLPARRAARLTSATVDSAGLRSAGPSSKLVGALARRGLPPATVVGVRMALERGQGRTSVPVGTAVVGAVMSIVTLVAAVTFAAGLERLLDSPSRFGWNWDISVGDGYGPDRYADVIPGLSASPTVAAISAGTFAFVEVGGRRVLAMGTDRVRGSVEPTVVEGRSPQGPDEVLLGTKTLRAARARIGDAVGVNFVSSFQGQAGGPSGQRLRVVGRGVLPEQSDQGLGEGAALTYEGLSRLSREPLPRNLFLVRFTPGADQRHSLDEVNEFTTLYTIGVRRPAGVANFGRVDAFPLLAGGLMGLVAVAMVVHTLAASVQRRRRDLGMLKTLGFVRRQVSGAVVWQATTVAVIALVVGLPIGVAAGRWTWTLVADQLGVVPEPTVPLVSLLLMIPGVLLVANLAAAVPAWAAARTKAALVLRTE